MKWEVKSKKIKKALTMRKVKKSENIFLRKTLKSSSLQYTIVFTTFEAVEKCASLPSLSSFTYETSFG